MMKQTSKHKSRRFRRFLRANEAVSALEYALVVGVIAVAVAAALAVLGTDITEAITQVGGAIDDPGTETLDLTP